MKSKTILAISTFVSLTLLATGLTTGVVAAEGNPIPEPQTLQAGTAGLEAEVSSLSTAPRVFRNLAYGPSGHQRLDLYLPRSGSNHRIVVFAHSGGWVGGDRSNIPPYMVDLTQRGWAVASISYLLATPTRTSWPTNLHDYKRATRWLRSQSAQYSLNPNIVVAAGASAGGNLATLAANTAGRSFEPTGLPANLASQRADYQGVISLAGPVNLIRFYRQGTAWSVLPGDMLGCKTRCSDAQLSPASPLTHLHRGSPPHYMVYGLQDGLVVPQELWDYQNRWNSVFSPGAAREKLWYETPNTGHNIETNNVNARRLHQFLDGVRTGNWVKPPVPSRCGFGDVPAGSYYAQSSCWLKMKDITTGFGGNMSVFAPAAIVDRAQMAAFLYRKAGSPSAPTSCGFRDVPTNSYYAQAACWLKANNITTGYGGRTDTFAPGMPVDRAQMAAFLHRKAGSPAASTSCGFRDVPGNAYYARAACWLKANNITTGYGGRTDTFAPGVRVDRAQMSAFLYRS